MGNDVQIALTQEQAAALIGHARGEFPRECCGLLAGRAGRVERIYRGTNIDRSPYTYMMDPKEQLFAFKEMEAAGLELLGIYHSHPTGPAEPSALDLARNYYPDAVHIIVSLSGPEPVVRAFLLEPDFYHEVRWTRMEAVDPPKGRR